MNTPTPEQKLKRALWLAFQASTPMGYGFLHADSAAEQTEDTLFTAATERQRPDNIYTDYMFGRMMKTRFSLVEGAVHIRPEDPRTDYQSWGASYKSATELLKAVDESFATEQVPA